MTYEKFREYGVSGGASTKLFAGVKALFPERFVPPVALAPAAPCSAPHILNLLIGPFFTFIL